MVRWRLKEKQPVRRRLSEKQPVKVVAASGSSRFVGGTPKKQLAEVLAASGSSRWKRMTAPDKDARQHKRRGKRCEETARRPARNRKGERKRHQDATQERERKMQEEAKNEERKMQEEAKNEGGSVSPLRAVKVAYAMAAAKSRKANEVMLAAERYVQDMQKHTVEQVNERVASEVREKLRAHDEAGFKKGHLVGMAQGKTDGWQTAALQTIDEFLRI
jgi:hypothetical protein